MSFLKIAAPKNLMQYIPAKWQAIPLSSNINGAELAAIVIDKNSLTEDKIATEVKEKAALDIPVIVADLNHGNEITQEIENKATEYINENVPHFLLDLVNFAQKRPVSFTTPGHHNGRYNEKHPAGVIFNQFFGENLLYADTSDTVAELGDTMTHSGAPLEAEQKAATVYNADKVYFCPNGTTGSNDICTSAILRPDDLVLFDRNNHKSLYNGALIMNGAKPVYIPTDRNALGLIGEMDSQFLTEEKLRKEAAKIDPQKAHQKRPFRMAVIQAETYDGVFYNASWLLKRIGKLCDYVLFDCAWGGFEQFVDLMNDLSPLNQHYGKEDPGILVTQSLHKQQVGMGSASQILKKDAHIKEQDRYVDHKHFNNAYLKYVTSSYNYPLYASMTVNAYLSGSNGNRKWWDDTLKRGINWRKKLIYESKIFRPLVPVEVDGKLWEDIPTDKLASDIKYWKLNPQDDWHGFKHIAENEAIIDPLKLTIQTPGIDVAAEEYEKEGIPGDVVAEFLTEHRILKAKADLNSLLFLLTPGDTESDLDALMSALIEFENLYEEDAPLEKVLPGLYQQYTQRYAGYTIKQLCQEMHEYYQAHQTFKLQQRLFQKPQMQAYDLQPAEADLKFRHNQSELCNLKDVEGRIAMEGALPYPPGVFIVAPGERWQKVDVDYFETLVGAMERFDGFVPEIQGVHYAKDKVGKIHVECEVLKE
ncbi:putative ornithine decarboxylase [Ligilactobacillus sp. LYQ135]